MPTTYEINEKTPSGYIDERGVRHYVREFQVFTSNPLDGPARICKNVPYRLFESYPYPGEEDPDAILKSVRPQPTDVLGEWKVTLEYDSAPLAIDRGATRPDRSDQTPKEAGTGNNANAPEQRPWVLKWGSVKTTKLLRRDRSGAGNDPFVKIDPHALGPGGPPGKLVATSAGQMFDPPISVPVDHPTLSITAFSSFANVSNIPYWTNRVNHHRWLGWSRDCARCTQYNITSIYEQNRFIWQIDVVVEFNLDGWNPVEVLDAGTFAKKQKSPADLDAQGNPIPDFKLVPILSSRDGSPVTSPVPLDGFGAPLKLGTKELVFLNFQGYYRGNFRALLRQDLGAYRRPRG